MFLLPSRLAWFAILLIAAPAASPAQTKEDVPARTIGVRTALEKAEWVETGQGLQVLQARSEAGQSITAFRISPDHFAFALAIQQEAKGERVDVFGNREGAVIAINGGFFGEEEQSGALYSVGLLRVGGRDLSSAWESAGGLAVLSDGRLSLRPSSAGAPKGAATVLQSKPMLIEPGGKWAMNTNQGHLRPRSLLCTLANGDVAIVAVRGAGMSLYEAGWLMRGVEEGGFFGCDGALALDGGGSTQLWVADHPEWSFRGETPVHNALVVRRRAPDPGD
ncbi:MAG: phosphodiester glycosidase family protein [Nitratireductor sp.]|nr:phosphodiester glycosidase family protein [Nitratireductor sp.]